MDRALLNPALSAPELERAEKHLLAIDSSIRSAAAEISAKRSERPDWWPAEPPIGEPGTCIRPAPGRDDEDRAVRRLLWKNPEHLRLLEREIAHRMEQKRSLAHHALQAVIPNHLRRVFLGGGYEVTARAADGREITLGPRDLAGADVDLLRGTLAGSGTEYTDVLVRPAAIEKLGDVPTPEPLPPFNRAEARALLAAEKLRGPWKERPAQDDAIAFFERNFSGVTRQPVREILADAYGEGKRGPRADRRNKPGPAK